MTENPRKPETGDDEAGPREAETSREAAAEGETPQDFETKSEPADSRPAFGDDTVTPRLNDGR